LPDLAEQLGLRYHELYHMVRRLELNLELYSGTREYQVTSEAAAALRAEHERVRALHRRSMKLAAAARRLKVAASTAGLLAKNGSLEMDIESDSSGAKFVTRKSVEHCWIARNAAAGRRKTQVAVGVPVAEVARFTGDSTAELMDLVRADVLEQVSGRRSCQLTAASLRAWMTSRHLDAMPPVRADGPETYPVPEASTGGSVMRLRTSAAGPTQAIIERAIGTPSSADAAG
jgi:hypothetical protein